MGILIDTIIVLIMVTPLLYGLFHIVKNKKIDTTEKFGWFILCLFANYAGLILYAFFRESTLRILNPILSSMAREKKFEMDEKWKK